MKLIQSCKGLKDLLRKKEQIAFEKQQGRCFHCGEPMKKAPYRKEVNTRGWTRDHLVPDIFTGTLHHLNLVLAHTKCNSSKGDKIPDDEMLRKAIKTFGWDKAQEGQLFDLRDKAKELHRLSRT